MSTLTERKLWDALKFGTSGEVNSKEVRAQAEGLLVPIPKSSEVGTPQVELDGAVGEALVLQPPVQLQRTKLIFHVKIDNPFLD